MSDVVNLHVSFRCLRKAEHSFTKYLQGTYYSPLGKGGGGWVSGRDACTVPVASDKLYASKNQYLNE